MFKKLLLIHIPFLLFSCTSNVDQEEIKKAQSDKPGKNDPRRTPAPKKDQKRGSKKNKPDSAKNPSGKIVTGGPSARDVLSL